MLCIQSGDEFIILCSYILFIGYYHHFLPMANCAKAKPIRLPRDLQKIQLSTDSNIYQHYHIRSSGFQYINSTILVDIKINIADIANIADIVILMANIDIFIKYFLP